MFKSAPFKYLLKFKRKFDKKRNKNLAKLFYNLVVLQLEDQISFTEMRMLLNIYSLKE